MKVGDKVSKVGGDYTFDGTIVADFLKLSGLRRFVVEDDRGTLHIYSEKNLQLAQPVQKAQIVAALRKGAIDACPELTWEADDRGAKHAKGVARDFVVYDKGQWTSAYLDNVDCVVDGKPETHILLTVSAFDDLPCDAFCETYMTVEEAIQVCNKTNKRDWADCCNRWIS